jgi:excisionase family DNA binding protein
VSAGDTFPPVPPPDGERPGTADTLDSPLLTPDELAAILKASTRTVRRLDDEGKIPAALRFGRLKRWRSAEIDEWLAAGAPDRREWNAIRSTRARRRIPG